MRIPSFLLMLLCLLAGLAVTAQSNRQFGLGYNLFLPKADMKKGFGSAHGFDMDLLYALKKAPFIRLGADMQYSIYASSSRQQEFAFRDGSTTIATVNLNSQIVSLGAKARFECPLAKESGGRVKPYGQVQAGVLSMYSTLYVEDPHDDDGCKPLEKRTPVKDYTWYAGAGGGLMIDLAGKKNARDTYFLDIGLSCIGGGKQRYANMGKVYDAAAADPSKPGGLNVQFVNVSTNEVHEHRVADVYEHAVRLAQVQVRFVCRF